MAFEGFQYSNHAYQMKEEKASQSVLYVDDIVKIAEFHANLQTHLESLWKALKSHGLRISREKIENTVSQWGDKKSG